MLTTREFATANQVLNAALKLKQYSVDNGLLSTPEKVYAQINAEKGCFAFGIISQGLSYKTELSPEQKAKAETVSNFYRDGFNTLLAEIQTADKGAWLWTQSADFNTKSIYYTTLRIVDNNRVFDIALSRKDVQGKMITSICFIERKAQEQPVTQPVAESVQPAARELDEFLAAH